MKDSEKTKEQLLWELKKLRQQVASDNKAKELEIAHLNRVLDTVNSTLNLDSVVERVMEALKDIFNFNQISIFLFNAEKEALEMKYWYGVGVTDEVKDRFANWAISTEWDDVYFVRSFLDIESLYVSPITPKLLEYYSERDRQMFEWNPHKAIAIVPLQVQEKVIGIINFVDTEQPFSLQEQDRNRIERYVGQIASTINNAYLVRKTEYALNEAREKEKEIAHINEIIKAANSTLDFDEVFRIILKGLQDVFVFDAIGIQLVDEKSELLDIYKVYAESAYAKYVEKWKSVRITTERAHSVTSYVFNTGEPAYFPNITTDMPFTETDLNFFQILPFVSYLAYPLIVQGRAVGVISFFGVEPRAPLTEKKLEKIQRYVASVSALINNAKSYQQLKSQEKIFKALLETGQPEGVSNK